MMQSATKRLLKKKRSSPIPFAYKVTAGVIAVDETSSITAVAKTMLKHNIGVVIVKKRNRLCGILSERDIVRKVIAKKVTYDKICAKDVMTRRVVTIDLEQGLQAIYEQMKKIPFRHLPVRSKDSIIGMVSNRDLMYLRELKAKR
jgi:CBS domain-containing protein